MGIRSKLKWDNSYNMKIK